MQRLIGRLASLERQGPAASTTIFELNTAIATKIKIPVLDKYDSSRAKLRTYLTQLKDYLENFLEVNIGAKKVRVAARFLSGAAYD